MTTKHRETETSKFMLELAEFGIKTDKVHRNLSVDSLTEIIISRNEGTISSTGALSVTSGNFTGRAPDDRYIVDDDVTHDTVHWGTVNHPISEENFEKILKKIKNHIEGKEIFVFDGFVGADPKIRIGTQKQL